MSATTIPNLRSKRKRSALSELQLTPGLGRRREECKKTPLRRKARVLTGVCGETVPLRTPRKLDTPRRKRLRASTVQEVHLEVPAVEGLIPQTTLVIKSNPLYRGTVGKQAEASGEHTMPEGMSAPCDGARNPLFYGQRRKIRKTKEQEMITAIMDLAQYGERRVSKTSRAKRVVKKAKALLGRHKTKSDIAKSKSPTKKGAFFLRPKPRTT